MCTKRGGARRAFPTATGSFHAPNSRLRVATERHGESSTGRVRIDVVFFYPGLTSAGVPVSEKEELISGALKYSWKEGKSKAASPSNSTTS